MRVPACVWLRLTLLCLALPHPVCTCVAPRSPVGDSTTPSAPTAAAMSSRSSSSSAARSRNSSLTLTAASYSAAALSLPSSSTAVAPAVMASFTSAANRWDSSRDPACTVTSSAGRSMRACFCPAGNMPTPAAEDAPLLLLVLLLRQSMGCCCRCWSGCVLQCAAPSCGSCSCCPLAGLLPDPGLKHERVPQRGCRACCWLGDSSICVGSMIY